MKDNGQSTLGIYIHVPFCSTRCHFCAFYLLTKHDEHIPRFLRSIKKEIALQQHLYGRRVSSIYFGGGTPTRLSVDQLFQILECVRTHFPVEHDCEITVEGTPESLSTLTLDGLREIGVTRLSLGVQSFQESERRVLGLPGSLDEILPKLEMAQESQIPSLNLDLLYGIPGQTCESWMDSLEEVMRFKPSHVSCYALTVEEGTRFERELRRGKVSHMDLEEECLLQSQADVFLQDEGFGRYEISNWALSGRACQHNLRYWTGEDYLGLGPSAQSYVGNLRYGNCSDLEGYMTCLEQGELPVMDKETLTEEQTRKERVVFGLRLIGGVPKEWVHILRHDLAWNEVFGSLKADQLVDHSTSHFFLTPKGRRLADEVGMQLI